MPKHNKQVLVEVVRRERQTKNNNKRKKRPRRRKTNDPETIVARMLANPCGSALVHGYARAEGSLQRFHKSISLSGAATATTTCGVLLWSPDFSPAIATDGESPNQVLANLLGFASNFSSQAAANAGVPSTSHTGGGVIAEFLAGTTMVSSCTLLDPAHHWNTSDLIQDVRCLSACLQLTPTGRLADVSGQFAKLTGITTDMLVANPGHSVDDWFNYASDTGPISRDPIEVRYRPTEASEDFRDEYVAPIYVGGSATPSTRSATARVQVPTWFGIAWRGVDVTVGHPFVIDLIKNTESRIRPFLGMAHAPAVDLSTNGYIKPSLEKLDRSAPNWQVSSKESMDEVIAEIAMGAKSRMRSVAYQSAGGILNGLFRAGMNRGTGNMRAITHDGL